MNAPTSRLKKSPPSKAQRKSPAGPRCRTAQTSRSPRSDQRNGAAQQRRPASVCGEFRAWRTSLSTALERDTPLMPDAIADSVAQEAERFLKAGLPTDFAKRLAAKAHYLYPRHKQFRETLNRPGNRGRDNLYVFIRHWTCAWLKRERSPLYRWLALGIQAAAVLIPIPGEDGCGGSECRLLHRPCPPSDAG